MGQASSNKKKNNNFCKIKTSKKNQGFCLFPSGVEQTGTTFKTVVILLGAWIGS